MRVPSHPLRRIFAPDTPVETFGLIKPAACDRYTGYAIIALAAAMLVIVAITAEPMLALVRQ